jgi:Acetyltransferase (GNAT) domain
MCAALPVTHHDAFLANSRRQHNRVRHLNAYHLNAYRYTRADEAEWNTFVRRARVPHFLFERGYMDYHSDRFEDASLLVREGGRLFALLPGNRVGETLWSHQGLTFGGLIVHTELTVRRALGVFDAIVAHARDDGIARMVYKAIPHVYQRIPSDEDLYVLFRRHARLIRRDLSAAIRLDERLPYRKGRRASLKRAKSSDLQVAPSTDFEAFMALEERTLARHGATPTHTGAELALLAGRFPDHIRLHVALAHDDVLAGVVTYETPLVTHMQYVGATEEGRARGAVDLLVDHAINDATRAARRWFEFGISTTAGGHTLNEGLARNKESYGGRAIVYDWYELEL